MQKGTFITMIVDRFENWKWYFREELGNKIFSFIHSLNEHSPDTDMEPLCGDTIKTRVMSYETKDPKEAIFEAHRKYIDIQFTLSGKEAIVWLPEVLAKPRTEYDVKNDVLFYHNEMSNATLINNMPGQFMVLFPGEVHGAGIWINNTVAHVKKAVIKIERETFFNFNG